MLMTRRNIPLGDNQTCNGTSAHCRTLQLQHGFKFPASIGPEFGIIQETSGYQTRVFDGCPATFATVLQGFREAVGAGGAGVPR
jgi:hypothetical protein